MNSIKQHKRDGVLLAGDDLLWETTLLYKKVTVHSAPGLHCRLVVHLSAFDSRLAKPCQTGAALCTITIAAVLLTPAEGFIVNKF